MSRGNIEGLYGETTEGIPFDISSHLTSMGKLIADRTGLIFMLKSKKTLTDETAEYSDTESANLVVEGNIVSAYVADYTSIVDLLGIPHIVRYDLSLVGTQSSSSRT
jgi:hypothetical protein